MKIASSDIQLASQHLAQEKNSVNESMRAWVGQRPDFEGHSTAAPLPPMDRVTLSSEGMAAQKTDPAGDAQDEISNDPRIQLIRSMVEAMTGRKIHVMSLKDLQGIQTSSAPPAATGSQGAAQPTRQGVEYDRHETHYEAEQTAFQAQGIVKTADGQKISFNLQLSMSREFASQSDVSIRVGDAVQKTKDPLVINFSGNAAQLTSTKFSFDLDSDGKAEQISFVSPGSGFLALDKNQDGKINDGGELFGPASGNGFSDLAAHDQDGNHWIDENDAAFNQLKVWSKDEQGNDHLATLKETGVGAIYLGNTATEFSIKDANNRLDGQVRSSGVYLSEDGEAGSVQQIDLAA